MALPSCRLAVCCLVALLALSTSVTAAPKYPNIIAYVKSEPKFSIAYSYIKKAGIEKALSNGKLEVTLFLPTNKAFTSSVKSFFNDIFPSLRIQALMSHAVSGTWTTSCLKTGVTLETLETGLDESPRTIIPDSLAVPGKTILRALWSTATILSGNVRAGKAIVHEVDNVLLFQNPGGQPQESAYRTIEDAVAGLKLSKFAGMVAGYKPDGSRLAIEDVWSNSEVPGTVFAWTDAVFDKTVKECGTSSFSAVRIVAYSFTFDLLPLPRMASNYQYKSLYMEAEERVVAPASEARITYLKGNKYPSILVDGRRRVLNITQTVYTRLAVLHLVDGIPFPRDRDGLCGY